MKIAACLSVPATIMDHFETNGSVLLVIFLFVSVFQLAAFFCFFGAMKILVEATALREIVESWDLTRKLFHVIYFIPYLVFLIAAFFFVLSGRSRNFNLDPSTACLVTPLLVGLAAPMIHLYLSISRFARGVKAAGIGRPSPGVFPVILLEDYEQRVD